MADKKISQLTTNPGIDGTEVMPTAKSGSNFKNTLTALKTWILSGISGYVKTDGTTTGATSQAQELTNGATITLSDDEFLQITREYIRIKSFDNDGDMVMNIQNGSYSATKFDGTGNFFLAQKDGMIYGVNLAHPQQLATPADAVKINGVKVYRALLSQSGTNAPTATVLENTLGETPTFSYSDVGNYGLSTIGSVFTANKTMIYLSQPDKGDAIDTTFYTSKKRAGDTTIKLMAFSVDGDGNPHGADDVLNITEIKIEINP